MSVTRCDIFCKVIDNFGDIGVCWRLARQLACEHGLAVRLWVDDLKSFAPLAPALDLCAAQQTLAGVTVCCWDHAAEQAQPAQIVIEAFACDPPDAYLAAMAAQTPPPLWINLEYLSAEDWVERFHALPSPHPRLALVKHFFFPGFTPRTGGLLREAGLVARQTALRDDATAQAGFWRALGFAPSAEALRVSLFAYENEAVTGLLEAWANDDAGVFCALPPGRLDAQVNAWLSARGADSAAREVRVGALTLARLPFLPQDDYDRLLACCALNFVRGEDSFVRAQWAGRPLVWHIYQQDEEAHRAKLAAFLARYTPALAAADKAALEAFWQAWERGSGAGAEWPRLRAALPALAVHARRWSEARAAEADLAGKLLIFCQNLLECRAL